MRNERNERKERREKKGSQVEQVGYVDAPDILVDLLSRRLFSSSLSGGPFCCSI